MSITGPRARLLALHYTTNVCTLHCIWVDIDATVEVVGDPENAAYEWLIRRDGQITEHSDCGHGQSAIALRDGLMRYFFGDGCERPPAQASTWTR